MTLNNLINRGMLTSVDEILEYSDGTAAGFLAPDGEYSAIRSSGTGPDGTFWVLQGVMHGRFQRQWLDGLLLRRHPPGLAGQAGAAHAHYD